MNRSVPLALLAAMAAAVPARGQSMTQPNGIALPFDGGPMSPGAIVAPPGPLPAAPARGFLPSPMESDDRPTGMGASVDRADVAFGAFQRGYFATALAEANAELDRHPGDGAAMALVGEIYSEGLAVRADSAEADRWFKLASEHGNREGSFAYGLALLRGTGVPKDVSAAVPYLQRAADQNHAGALYNLGILALEADPKTRDDARAAALFQRSADGGDVDATYALANLYKVGEGVKRDLAQAAALFKSAADRGDPAGQVDYAIMVFNGEGIPKDEAQAARYFRMAAYTGNPVAANRLARLYAAGRGIEKNPVEAARWHLLARAAGVPDPWLDTVLASLAPADKSKVEDELRRTLAN